MGLWESKEERQKRLAESEKEEARLEQERREAERKRAEEARRKKLEDFLKYLEKETKTEDIIAVTISDNPDTKQAAMNYLLTHGYTCVQNDATCTKYTVHYVMTFVKDELAFKFKNK